MARDDQGPAGTQRARMGPMTGPVSLEEPLRCRKPGSLAREVYWHLRNCSAENAMVGMRLILRSSRARSRFLIGRGPRRGGDTAMSEYEGSASIIAGSLSHSIKH
jgi:hypothetical protein